jgi:hypothetical protein
MQVMAHDSAGSNPDYDEIATMLVKIKKKLLWQKITNIN